MKQHVVAQGCLIALFSLLVGCTSARITSPSAGPNSPAHPDGWVGPPIVVDQPFTQFRIAVNRAGPDLKLGAVLNGADISSSFGPVDPTTLEAVAPVPPLPLGTSTLTATASHPDDVVSGKDNVAFLPPQIRVGCTPAGTPNDCSLAAGTSIQMYAVVPHPPASPQPIRLTTQDDRIAINGVPPPPNGHVVVDVAIPAGTAFVAFTATSTGNTGNSPITASAAGFGAGSGVAVVRASLVSVRRGRPGLRRHHPAKRPQ